MSVLYPSLSNTTFPNTIQSFVTFLNITPTDASLIQKYQLAVQSGNMEEAENIFGQIQNGNQKIIDATKLNTLVDTTVALENFFKTDVFPYIDVKQNEWQNIIFAIFLIGLGLILNVITDVCQEKFCFNIC